MHEGKFLQLSIVLSWNYWPGRRLQQKAKSSSCLNYCHHGANWKKNYFVSTSRTPLHTWMSPKAIKIISEHVIIAGTVRNPLLLQQPNSTLSPQRHDQHCHAAKVRSKISAL